MNEKAERAATDRTDIKDIKDIYEELENLWLLQDCGPDTRRQFVQLGKIVSYPKGCVCLRARENSENIFFILRGKVQIYNLTGCGKKKILFVLGKDHIANDSLAGGPDTVFCETLESCSFYVLRRSCLLALMEQDFGLARCLLDYQEGKLRRLEHQLKNTVGSIYLERKLASKLWKLARDFGIRTDRGLLIDLELSVTFLADLLGAPRETTSRVCHKLTEYGLITTERKKIYITDPEKMAHFFKHRCT